MLQFPKYILLILCTMGVMACSDSSTDITTTNLDDLETFVQWAGHSWDDLGALVDSSKSVNLDYPVACEGGGTIDLVGSSITFNDCTETAGTTTYVTRGTYTVTESVSLVTHEWDYTVGVDDSTSFTSTGSISFNTSDDLIAFDYSGVFTSGTFRLTGVVSDNSDGTSDVTFSVLLDGEQWQNGSFDNADLDTLSADSIDAACTDDDDSACDTLECTNDFQCQLFADSDSTDAYETGNIECAAGCCALIAEVEVDACPGSSVCSNDYQCQVYADSDSTDNFVAGSTECSAGCCAVIAEAEEEACPGSSVCSSDFQCQLFADSDLTDAYETGNTECSAGCCAVVE